MDYIIKRMYVASRVSVELVDVPVKLEMER